MKRTIGICLFAAVMLLVGGLCGKTAFDAGRIRTAEETEAVTEDAAVAQTERTAESMQIQKTCRYLLRMDDDGILKVYEADGITLLFETNIRAGTAFRADEGAAFQRNSGRR